MTGRPQPPWWRLPEVTGVDPAAVWLALVTCPGTQADRRVVELVAAAATGGPMAVVVPFDSLVDDRSLTLAALLALEDEGWLELLADLGGDQPIVVRLTEPDDGNQAGPFLEALYRSPATPDQRAVATVLAATADEGGVTTLTIEQAAAIIGQAEHVTRSALAELIAAGWVEYVDELLALRGEVR